MDMAFNPGHYFVSDTHGFLLEKPLDILPAYFQPWNGLAVLMPQLVEAGTMRQYVHQLPLLDWTRLEGHRQKCLAHLQLTIMTSGYVWEGGEKVAAKVLPACLAVPLCGLSEELGIPPVIAHSGVVLANHALIDPSRPFELDNLRPIYHLPGEKETEWFTLVLTAVEFDFAKALKWIMSALEGSKRGDVKVVTTSLVHITQVVRDMQHTVSRMHEKLTSNAFFSILRPFFAGWGGEDSGLPEGLIYEGVSDQPVQTIGGSAAQSSTVQVLDALMGVKHAREKAAYMLKNRDYMPPAHRQFIEAVAKESQSLQNMVKNSGSEDLSDAYDTLLSAMVDFRTYHIQIVAKYIVGPAAKAKKHTEHKYESLHKRGTGGSNLLAFLKELRQDTRDSMTDAKSSYIK